MFKIKSFWQVTGEDVSALYERVAPLLMHIESTRNVALLQVLEGISNGEKFSISDAPKIANLIQTYLNAEGEYSIDHALKALNRIDGKAIKEDLQALQWAIHNYSL